MKTTTASDLDVWHAVIILQPITDRALAKKMDVTLPWIRKTIGQLRSDGADIGEEPMLCIGDKRPKCFLYTSNDRDMFN